MAKVAENIKRCKMGKCGIASSLSVLARVQKVILVFLFLVTTSLINPATLYADCLASPVCLIAPTMTTVSFNQKIAPEFPVNLQWLNTDSALWLRDIKGKVVLLDFWTYCCINCQHILPELAMLEKKYPDELVVIGVHSGKFIGEKDSDNIRQAILRHGIRHPVVNDANMQIWRNYGVRAWPTLVLIDPMGRIVGRHSGEGVFKAFDRAIASVIKEFDRRGLIDRRPLNLVLETNKTKESVLSFPGGILADESSGRLFISDSGHHRIIIAGLDGDIIDTCGSGQSGYLDGSFKTARFNRPQGLALSGKTLFVADTENHCVRAIDISNKMVSTLAGTGKQGQSFNIRGMANRAALNSPWALEVIGNRLYVAMAGAHQLYRIDLQRKTISPFAGTGVEGRIDGPRQQAALAQPSGLATDGGRLYFTDSESSSVRWVELRGAGVVTTIVGLGLFQFGDRDGKGSYARLQHPLGVTYYNELLYVADTYNNKIKVIDPHTATSMTFLGNPTAGSVDDSVPLFDEPGDVSHALGKLFIADTNNHLIRVADIKTAKVTALQLRVVKAETLK